MSDRNFITNKSLITKSENELIETLISNDTKIHDYKNKIELIQKLGDGNIIVISRKTVGNLNSTNPKKVNKITTINLIEESYDSEYESFKIREKAENINVGEMKEIQSESKEKERKIISTHRKKILKKKNEKIVKPIKRRISNYKNIYNFEREIKRNEFTAADSIKSISLNNNFNNLSNELKPNLESDIVETLPDSMKPFDIQSIVDSVAENRKIRVTRSKMRNAPHSSYFLSQLNDVKDVSSVRVRYLDINKRLDKEEQ